MSRSLRTTMAAALLALALPVAAGAEPGDIKGQDVKGDVGRSANDGWSQAPVPREQSAGKDAPDPGGTSTQQNASRPVPDAGKTDNSSKDPQQTIDARTPSPSGKNPDAPTQ